VARAANGVQVGVINVMGRVFMTAIDDPFRVVAEQIDKVRADGARLIFIDFHAEATSEKVAMGWHLDGRVAAVVGTHTHVATADQRVLPQGTAYITDVGMTGRTIRSSASNARRSSSVSSPACRSVSRPPTKTPRSTASSSRRTR
jgi:calcineurin-like phosphoesterase